MSFKNLKLIPPIEHALEKQGYTVPTPIQLKSIPDLLIGRDLIGIAQTGTGKTASTKYTINEMVNISSKKNIPLKFCYINCKLKKTSDTEYRLVAQLARELGREIPATGLPTEEVYKAFFNALDSEKRLMVIVLDEIDQLVKRAGDEILYNLTRMNEELKNAQVTVIGISNDIVFIDNIDPRIKSSLSEEEIMFHPYNALQLQDILKQRSEQAFKENVIEPGVIEKCAAYAAREHGDARRALELLRVAGEVAERNNFQNVKIEHIDAAEEKIERERMLDMITSQPKQVQLTIYALLALSENRKQKIFTGEMYELYKQLCVQVKMRPLTQRRVSDIVAELDMAGIINVKVISKGRYGRTREINLMTPKAMNPQLKKILEDALEMR